jgi:hypothetical protein
MGSQHVSQVPTVFSNMFSIAPHFAPHMLCPKFYSCNLYICTPKGGGVNNIYYFWDYPQLDLVFCDEPIKDAHHKGRTFAGWVSPQLINTPITNHINNKVDW